MRRAVALLFVAPLAVVLAAQGCADFSSGQCTDKALCTETADASPFDGTQVDAPIDDVIIDTVVVPDVVPDGDCNGGAENCSNGIDDNCNGLIDCADPVCQAAGYVCTAPPPAGWSGPVALASAAGGTIPACGGAYATATATGHAGLTAGAAMCGCSCGSATGELCFPTINYYFDTACGTYNQDDGLPYNFCTNVGSGNGSVKGVPGVAYGGTCTPNGTMTVPPLSWSNSYAVCGYDAPTDSPGGCTTGSLCVESPGGAFSSKPCIYQNGDIPCPGSPYTVQTVIYTTDSDNRGCTTCTCNYEAGSCTAPITAWTAGSCSGSSLALSTDNTCHTFAGWSAVAGTIDYTAGTCPANAVSANGSASATGPVTVCCAP